MRKRVTESSNSKNSNMILIKDSWGSIDRVVESLEVIPSGSPTGSVLSTIEGPVFCYVKPTRNERTYSKDLCMAVINSDYVQELIKTKSFLGEADHPDDNRLNVHFPNVSHAIRDIRDDPVRGCFVATIDILDTPNGRILEVLRRYGTILGISSRGSGSIITKNGQSYVDPSTYVFSTFDIVHYPGNIDSRLRGTDNPILESNSYDTDGLENLTSIFKSYIESDSKTAKNYKDESSIEEIIDKAIKERDYQTLLSAKAILMNLGIAPKLLAKIEGYLTHSSIIVGVAPSYFSTDSTVIDSLKSELKSSKDEIKSLTKSIEALSNSKVSNADIERQIEELSSQLADSNSKLDTQESNLADAIATNERLEHRVEDLIKSKLQIISKYEDSISDLRSDIQELESKLDTQVKLTERANKSTSDLLSTYTTIRCNQLGLDPRLVESYQGNIKSVDQVESMIESVQRNLHRASTTNRRGNTINSVRLMESSTNRESSEIVSLIRQLKS